jgi:hypothetical protein
MNAPQDLDLSGCSNLKELSFYTSGYPRPSATVRPTSEICPKKKKKTLVLTNVGKRAGRYYIPAGKGRWGRDYILASLKISELLVPGKKKILNPGINPGQPAGKGWEKKPWY